MEEELHLIKVEELINSDIFQRQTSFSPFLFCIALVPISSLLNDSSYGYATESSLFIIYSIWMTSKLSPRTNWLSDHREQLDEFELQMCQSYLHKRVTHHHENIQIDLDTTVEELEKEDMYKYLRVHEGDRIQHAKLKVKIRKEHNQGIRLGTKSECNSTNQMKAIKTLANQL